MSAIAYYAKLNLESHILQVYDERKILKNILDELVINLVDDLSFTKELEYIDDDGNNHKNEIKYKLGSIQKLDEKYDYSIVGYIYKKSIVYLKDINENTGEITTRAEDNTEVITFYLDIYREMVVFYTTQRFGYNEFCEALQGIINSSFKKTKYIFSVELYRDSININNIKEELRKLGKISEIKIDIKAPNPDSKVLEDLEEGGSRLIETYKEGNITGRSIILTSKAPKGLILDSEVVNEEFDKINKIHHKLSADEAIQKGYVHVNAKTEKKEYSTRETSPLKGFFDEKEKSIGMFIEVGKRLLRNLS